MTDKRTNRPEANDAGSDPTEAWCDVQQHVRRYGRGGAQPKSLQSVLNRVMAKRGYNQSRSHTALEEAWRTVVPGSMAGCSRVKKVSRGVLEVVVDNPVVLQQLTFIKASLLQGLQGPERDRQIKQIRFKLS